MKTLLSIVECQLPKLGKVHCLISIGFCLFKPGSGYRVKPFLNALSTRPLLPLIQCDCDCNRPVMFKISLMLEQSRLALLKWVRQGALQ